MDQQARNAARQMSASRGAQSWSRLTLGVGRAGTVLLVLGGLALLVAVITAFFSTGWAIVIGIPAVVLLVIGYKIFTLLA